MSNVVQGGRRFGAAIGLRDAALCLLQRKGKQSQYRERSIVFEEHAPENPTPRLSLSLDKHPLDGCLMLSVWTMLNGKHVKVLNVVWLRDKVQVFGFRRGEWESELLAMGKAAGVAVH